MKLTKYGRKEWLRATIIAFVLWLLVLTAGIFFAQDRLMVFGTIVLFLGWLAFVAFFRDPYRVPPSGEELLSPADGVVRDIELIRAPDCKQLAGVFKGEDMLRIGIFLSVFDVHINRAPCALKVTFKEHKDGKYYDARDPRAGKENESLMLGGTARIGEKVFPVAVKQVSGAIARRIVCAAEPGTELRRAEQYGMIKFGSRTELYLPAKGAEVLVRIGDKVTCGITPMARMNEEHQESK